MEVDVSSGVKLGVAVADAVALGVDVAVGSGVELEVAVALAVALGVVVAVGSGAKLGVAVALAGASKAPVSVGAGSVRALMALISECFVPLLARNSISIRSPGFNETILNPKLESFFHSEWPPAATA